MLVQGQRPRLERVAALERKGLAVRIAFACALALMLACGAAACGEPDE